MTSNEIKPALYGFNVCRDKYNCYNVLKTLINLGNDDDMLKIGAYNYYLEFVSELYEFYLSAGKREGKINDRSNYESKDELIMSEVKKLIRFYQRENMEPVPTDFAKKFRRIRNFKSHVASETKLYEFSLAEFYRKYHKYIMLLMEPPLFSWNHPVELWDDVNLFSEAIANEKHLTQDTE
jgi:hypothetical protein